MRDSHVVRVDRMTATSFACEGVVAARRVNGFVPEHVGDGVDVVTLVEQGRSESAPQSVRRDRATVVTPAPRAGAPASAQTPSGGRDTCGGSPPRPRPARRT